MGEMPSMDHEGTRILPETVRIQRGNEARERLATGEIYKLSDVKKHFEEQKVLAESPKLQSQYSRILSFTAEAMGEDDEVAYDPLQHAREVYKAYLDERSDRGEYVRAACVLKGLEKGDPGMAVGELERSIKSTMRYISEWEQKLQKIPMGRMPGDDVFARLEKEREALMDQKEKLSTDQSSLPQTEQVEQKIQALEHTLFNFEGEFGDARDREQPVRGFILGNLEPHRETVAKETGYRAVLQREFPQVYPQPLSPVQ